MTDQPKDGDKLKAAVANLTKGMESLALALNVQACMGAVWGGDLERARTTLRKLPPAKLHDVALSALALASLAETIAKEGSTE